MITEDYVSFETAKLLKEKGFDIALSYFYNSDGRRGYATSYNWNQTTGDFPDYSCPTQALAMKWLREVHGIHINLLPYDVYCTITKKYAMYKPKIYILSKDGCELEFHSHVGAYNNYEEACEAAIKYCLREFI